MLGPSFQLNNIVPEPPVAELSIYPEVSPKQLRFFDESILNINGDGWLIIRLLSNEQLFESVTVKL